jgi:hypothetical protein
MRSLPKLQGIKVQADCISIKESKEYEVIVNRLKLDVDKRKWTASYLVFVSPLTLVDNYRQARKCMVNTGVAADQVRMAGRVQQPILRYCGAG